jgi:hypothetical protein
MKFQWSVVLFVSILLAVATPLFFGHWLATHEGMWIGLAAVCLALASGLFFVQKRYRVDD